MGERQWEIGICGTFDVANYGDLLFPLIAERELAERLGAVALRRFSYCAKTPREWPYEVTSVTELPRMVHRLDGLIVGGGLLIRFDKLVAPGYVPPAPGIHHPSGYWLTPALLALQHDVPVVWNAPGTDGNQIPAWAHPLMNAALTLSRYVSVRDEASRAALAPLTGASIEVVPDTAFGLPRLLDPRGTPSAGFQRLCEDSGLRAPYIVIQARTGLAGFVRFVKKHANRFRMFQFLALPIGPVLGDSEEAVDADLPGLVRLNSWPNPLLISELIGRSEAVVSESYHLSIGALVAGVPVFARYGLPACKYSALETFDTYFALPPGGEPDCDWFLARVGRTEPSGQARARCDLLRGHWDRMAAALRAGRTETAAALNRFWQSLPALLEDGASGPEPLAGAAQKRLEETIGQLTVARAETAARDAYIGEIMASGSWKLTAPLRFFGRSRRTPRRPRTINLERLGHHRLETEPFEWAAIGDLFNPEDAEALAATYPCDHFKLVAAYGARVYEYEARPLIRMGAGAISFPGDLSDAWRALAADLLTPEYRRAMTALTGRDLLRAPMEANVFHYGPGGSLSAHPDLPDKLVTHVLYFNRGWNRADGGCLRILRSSDPADLAAEIPPILGYSSVIVRSDNSWHAVTRVADGAGSSRRSMTVTFYRPGAVSTMWPPGDATPLHRYESADAK